MPQSANNVSETAWFDYWNTSYRASDKLDPIASELFDRTAAVVNRITASGRCRVLEIACGTGSLSRQLIYHSYQGLDLSPAAIKVCLEKREKLAVPARFSSLYEVADIHDWSIPSEAFDLAVCVDAIAYFRDQRLATERIAKALRPGGRVVLTTINPFVYRRIKRTPQSPLSEGSVTHWLSRRELHTLIETAGFTIERSYTIMPRGNAGILRIVNSARLNGLFGSFGATIFRRLKEAAGLGQYRIVIARKRNAL